MASVDKLHKLTEQYNNLIVRIAGLTDYVLIEQAQEEYHMLEEKISKVQEQVLHDKIINICKEHIEFYKQQFTICEDIIHALEQTNNVDLQNDIRRLRLRKPEGLKNRKELCMLADAIQKQIVVRDMENIIVDEIGRDTSDKLTLYVYMNSTIAEYNMNYKPAILQLFKST